MTAIPEIHTSILRSQQLAAETARRMDRLIEALYGPAPTGSGSAEGKPARSGAIGQTEDCADELLDTLALLSWQVQGLTDRLLGEERCAAECQSMAEAQGSGAMIGSLSNAPFPGAGLR